MRFIPELVLVADEMSISSTPAVPVWVVALMSIIPSEEEAIFTIRSSAGVRVMSFHALFEVMATVVPDMVTASPLSPKST